MSEDVRYFRLGLFFLVSLGLLVTGIIFLGVIDYFRPTFTIETYFSTQSVRGLEVGAPVKILGVTTGKVTEIATAGLVYHRNEIVEALKAGNVRQVAESELQRSIVVRMEIVPTHGLGDIGELRWDLFEVMVDLGIRARLSQSGLAGPVFIDLEYVDPEIYPVPELPWEPQYFYVPSAPGILTELTAAATAILSRIRRADFTQTLESIDRSFQIVSQFAEGIDTSEIREDLVTIAEDVRQSGYRLREFLADPRLEQTLIDFAEFASGTATALKDRGKDLGTTLETIPRTASRLERIAARTEQLLEDERIDQILEGMSQAADSAGETMENTEATTAELRRLVRELNRLTMVLNEDLNVITENLRRITEDAEIITGEMKDNPSRLILGKEPTRSNPGGKSQQEKKP